MLSETLKAAIDAWQVADDRYRAEIGRYPDDDHGALWNEKERAEQIVIEMPCHSIEDIRAKVAVALRDENVFDSLANCRWKGEHGPTHFLSSLLGNSRFNLGEAA